jgi:hypothetical protein
MGFNLNQFKLSNIAGLVMNPAANVIQAQVLSTLGTASYYVAGQVVAFGTASGDIPTVRAVTTGCGMGIITFNAKRDKYYGNMVCGVALDGSIITCVAGAPIMRGQPVAYGSVTSNVAYVTGLSIVPNAATFGIGIALDIASAADDIIRVLIKAGVSGTSRWYDGAA